MTPSPTPTTAWPAGRPARCVARWLAIVLVAVAGLLGAQLHTSPRALADDAGPAVTVRINQVTPASPHVDDTLTVTGEVRNTSGHALRGVQVYLWRSTDALSDGQALTDALSSAPDNPLGRRVVIPDGYMNITDVGGARSQAVPTGLPELADGQAAAFTVRARVADLQLGDGTFLAGVQVRGTGEGGEPSTLGRARLLLPVAGPEATAVATHPVVLLSSRPSRVGGSLFADDHLADEFDGRLAALLSLAQQPGTTVLVDPALYDAAAVMAQGYTVALVPPPSSTALAHGQASARQFVAAVDQLVTQGRVMRTLAADADVRQLVAAGRTDVLDRAATLPSGHRLAHLPLAVVPAQGLLDEASLAALAPLHPAAVLASNLASTRGVQRAGGLVLVRVRDDAFDGGPGPAPTDTPAQVVGRLQATQRLGRDVVTLVTTEQQAGAESAAAPWRVRVPLSSLLRRSSAVEAQILPAPAVDPDRTRAAQGDQVSRQLATWGELVGEQATAQSLATQVLPAVWSSQWTDPAAMTSWLRLVSQQRSSASAGGGLQLRVTGNFVTSAAEQEIPVTITNDLDRAAQVRVVFTSENPQRISVADSPVVRVAPGDTDTVKVRVTARANGQVGVTAQLATSSGQRLGAVQQMTITATQAGRVGWVIIIASGVVLLAATAIRIRQVQAERRLSPGTGQAAHWVSSRHHTSD